VLNTGDIIGFPPQHAEARFELIAELQWQQHAEVARLTEIAVRLLARFGAETVVGFLFYEILGRPPDHPELLDYAARLHRTSSIAPFIVEEFLAFAAHSNERSSLR
jgi:hypothetical protein